VVLRVNSPGGSALASDVIWREVVLTKKVKPVIVSMGDLAASGGYYISCAADKIFAQPNTITGSIGVFGILPNTERMLKSKLGVTYDRVRTNAHSDLGSMSRPLDDMEFKVIQQGVDEIYSDFTYKVAEGRKHKSLTQSMVDSMGQGRVWSGEDALKLGLVDEIGGLQDAIREAAKRANLSEDGYQVIDLPKVKDPFQQFIEELSGETKIEFITKNFGLSPEMMLYLYDMKKMLSQKGVKAVMPYYLEIQ
jgi:protease-4